MVANLLVALVALLHVYFLVLEMFLWTKPTGPAHLRPVAAEGAGLRRARGQSGTL